MSGTYRQKSIFQNCLEQFLILGQIFPRKFGPQDQNFLAAPPHTFKKCSIWLEMYFKHFFNSVTIDASLIPQSVKNVTLLCESFLKKNEKLRG
jgi:hypothetical protein